MKEQTVRERFDQLKQGLCAPVMVAPMFLVSTPEMVITAARAGLVGAFPGPNARTVEDLKDWLVQLSETLASDGDLPWAMNMIVHKTYSRFAEELELVRRFKPKIVITALGSPGAVTDVVQGYGGLVFADVISPSLARKAVSAGADGLVLVCSGAGGHTGSYSPYAFVREVRSFFDGPVIVGGAISDGRGVASIELLGADLAYIGTRFIACPESMVGDDYRTMLIRATAEKIVQTKAITGVTANFLAESLESAGYDLTQLAEAQQKVDFSGDIAADQSKAWKNVWGAGQGVAAIEATEPLATIADSIVDSYRDTISGSIRCLDAPE